MTPFRVLDLPVDEIAAAYRAGDSTSALADRYGVSRKAIRRRLVAAGVSIRARGGRAKREYPVAEAIALYETGLSITTIAGRLGYARATLYQEMVMSGWVARPSGWHLRKPDELRDQVVRLAGRNVRVSEIAETVGVSTHYVQGVIREERVERQKVGRTSAPMRRVFLYGPGDRPLQRWCAPCATYHPLAEFGRNKRLKHGVAQACKRSVAEKSRAYRKRKRAQQSSSPPV